MIVTPPFIDVFFHGGAGRAGRAVISLARRSEGIRVRGLLDSRSKPCESVEGLGVFDHISKEGDGPLVVVDFSNPAAIPGLVDALGGTGAALVSGTTGLGEPERSLLEKYSEGKAVLYDVNMSYGISILKRLLAAAARVIDSDTDVEIVELHHRRKRDCPSGTTYALARALDPAARVVPGRNEPDPGAGRGRVIRAHSLRLGGVVGEHRVYLAMGDEVLTVSHAALSREAFARGALRAIYFVAGKDRGMYSMEDLASV